MKLVEATAKGKARKVTTKFGDRLVLDVIGNDGQEYAIWRPATDSQLSKIGHGERISLGIDSKNKAHLMETLADKRGTQVIYTEPEKEAYTAHNGRSSEIADYVQKLGKLYRYSYRTAREAMEGESLSSEDTRMIATSLFIQAIKHFDL